MKLTVGMACHTDFNGVYMTVNALRHYHSIDELVVIDNAPNTAQGEATAGFLKHIREIPVKYVPFEESEGTSQTRQAIFEHATSSAVLVLDCHVMLVQDAIKNLRNYYLNSPDTPHLYSGPLLMDNLSSDHAATHFDPVWRDEMWGIWAIAWITPTGQIVTTSNVDGKLHLHDIMTREPITSPESSWEGHEKVLKSLGYKIAHQVLPEFEIPGMGLGLFSCRKEAWLGFNPLFREFGGEELYIHEKYRQAGHKNICLSFLAWQHRFYKPEQRTYPISKESKFRNYIIGHQELGLDTTPVVEHFLARGISQSSIDRILSNPSAYSPPQKVEVQSGSRRDLFLTTLKTPRDLEQHGNYLAHMASQCKHVTEITDRKESTIFLIGGSPGMLVSYQEEQHSVLMQLKEYIRTEINNKSQVSLDLRFGKYDNLPDIVQTDMLFLDHKHTGETLSEELEKYHTKVNKFITIHDTMVYADKGMDGKKGFSSSILEFLAAHPDWYILHHNSNQYGITTLSKIPETKPELAIVPWGKECGPGTELKKLLSLVGITSSPSCGCNAKARIMDHEGPDWCKENLEKIVTWLGEEHSKRKDITMPFLKPAARLVVKRAISNARKIPCV